VIAPELRFVRVGPAELSALVRFVAQPPAESRVGDVRHGLVLLTRDGRPAALADLRRGFVPLPAWLARDAAVDREVLRRLRREHGATWAVAVGGAALRRLDAALSRAFDPSGDLLDGLLRLAHEAREARRAGELLFSPALLDDVPIPAAAQVRSAFDLVLPDDRTALFYAFGPQGLSFGLVAEKRRGRLVCVAGHEALGGIAVRGAQWRAAVPRILRETALRFAPPAVGVFGDEAALRRIVFGTEPAALPRALATREVILDPLPPWLAVLLGLDTAAKAAGTARSLLRRFDPLGLAERLDPARLARDLQQRLGVEHPLARALGFDPFAVLVRLQQWRDG